MPDRPMNRDELERLGALLFGFAWKARLADALDINRKTVSRWIAADEAPDWAAGRIREMAHIAPPPGTSVDQDRDDACAEAVEPRLTELVNLAESAGWHRAEIQAALLSLTVSDGSGNPGRGAGGGHGCAAVWPGMKSRIRSDVRAHGPKRVCLRPSRSCRGVHGGQGER